MHHDPTTSRVEKLSRAEELALEFLARRSEGGSPDVEEFRARLGRGREVEEFDALLHDAGEVERVLPRALSKDTVLGGRYRILREIGSGGMGRVFSALDLQLDRRVAVKVLSSIASGDPGREELFLKESRILAAMKHPNIVAVHEAGKDRDLTYIVMDLIEGVSLSDVIDRARTELEAEGTAHARSPREGSLLARAIGLELPHGRDDLIRPGDWYRSVTRVVVEIARTLEAAHGSGVIHRDLKPSNVMLLGGGSPVVLDFGLAGSEKMRAGAVTRGLYGSVAYLAPEQARTQQVGMEPATDVYQLGLILYELLTLRRAFPGTGLMEVMERIQAGVFEPPRRRNPAAPRDLESICLRALELDPARRYLTAKEMRQDLERWLDGQVPHASRSATWRAFVRRSRHTMRKHPVLSAAAGMLLVGLITWAAIPGDTTLAMHSGFVWNSARHPGPLAVQDGDEVHAGDGLGVRVKNNREVFVYACSLFGPDRENSFLAPWQPWLLSQGQDERQKWGLQIEQPGEWEVMCVQLGTQEQASNYEGLLVVTSPVERPELESWLAQLQRKVDENEGQGVPYVEAQTFLDGHFRPVRGAGSWTPEQKQAFLDRKRESAPNGTAKRLGLPGVDEFSIELRVAGK